MKKLLSSILIVVFLMFMVAVPVPVCAADRENFSVSNLNVQKALSLQDPGVIKKLGYGANWTLTADEAKHVVLRPSSGNGTPSIIDPFAKPGQIRYVRVEPGGAQVTSITIKKATTDVGTVSIAVGYGAWVQYLCDGTGAKCHYQRMTASSVLY